MTVTRLMRQRPFAYADLCRNAPAPWTKNESNCTVFLRDGTWFTTWSQGQHEGAPNERMR